MAALLLVAAVAMSITAPADAKKAAPPSFFGIVPDDELEAADYELMRQANVGAARVTLFWRVIEHHRGEYDWTGPDRLIGEFASRGITVLPNLYGIPGWLSNEPTSPPVETAQQQVEWERFVREAVTRYGPGGAFWRTVYPLRFPGAQPQPPVSWQVWNEENGPKHFWPRPDVSKYATLAGIAKRAITAVDPGGQVVTGGLASKPTGDGGLTAWKFVKKLTKTRVGRESFDHVGLHPYARNDREIAKHVKKIRRALKKGHKKKAQLWITEVGWSSVPDGASPKLSKSPTGQRKLLKKTYALLERKRRPWRIGGVYWYTWRDFNGGICDWCPNSGLVTQSMQPKPAYSAFRKVAG